MGPGMPQCEPYFLAAVALSLPWALLAFQVLPGPQRHHGLASSHSNAPLLSQCLSAVFYQPFAIMHPLS